MSNSAQASGSGSKPSGNGGGVGPSRRTWDVEEYAQRAKDREKREREHMELNEQRAKKGLKPLPRRRHEDLPAPTESLQARSTALDLDKNVGKTMIVEQVGRRGPGYYCELCRKTCKDSIGYLDHVNGRSHLRRLGQKTQVDRSTPQAVRARIEHHRSRLVAAGGAGKREYDFAARVEEIARKEREEKERKREEKRERKRQKREEETGGANGVDAGGGGGEDAAMMAMMGFGGFGSSKK
ncbi:hypothetical protein BDZ90DRAFT_276901 [Jaminaea rosea]|uniref:U1-type domain-containing protein n=1 Tax=Jaminaea rosea TaxID=1569628 RepID=A0A316UYQ1_9BASI|nr:hypothetical protein BDZ90DRAFT_276901 [Jaminaea rosea]PWN30437.1 hypothetical protein BDZ90DRAFT_276901 [Jaminaea rosea]